MQTTHEIEVYFAPFGYVTVEYTRESSGPDFPDESGHVTRTLKGISLGGDDFRDYLSEKALNEFDPIWRAEAEAEEAEDYAEDNYGY